MNINEWITKINSVNNNFLINNPDLVNFINLTKSILQHVATEYWLGHARNTIAWSAQDFLHWNKALIR